LRPAELRPAASGCSSSVPLSVSASTAVVRVGTVAGRPVTVVVVAMVRVIPVHILVTTVVMVRRANVAGIGHPVAFLRGDVAAAVWVPAVARSICPVSRRLRRERQGQCESGQSAHKKLFHGFSPIEVEPFSSLHRRDALGRGTCAPGGQRNGGQRSILSRSWSRPPRPRPVCRGRQTPPASRFLGRTACDRRRTACSPHRSGSCTARCRSWHELPAA